MGDDAAALFGEDALLEDDAGGAPDVHPACLLVGDVAEGGGEEELDDAVAYIFFVRAGWLI